MSQKRRQRCSVGDRQGGCSRQMHEADVAAMSLRQNSPSTARMRRASAARALAHDFDRTRRMVRDVARDAAEQQAFDRAVAV